ncbi:hypothetical protein [Singulisphaera sp. PoT]|uniref:hypothetical protein n=1 Tax=Singulisphaera sp. PoT TaxID=3411797 RepID=UPI003BF4F43A
MLSIARMKSLAAVAAVLMLATIGASVQGRQAPDAGEEKAKAAPDNAASREIAKKQLVLAEQALDTVQRLARNGRLEVNDPSVAVWELRRLEALRKTGAGKAEMVAAIEKYLKDLEEQEAIAVARKESARGTQVPIYDVQYRRMEAEIWLSEEKTR